MWGSFCNWIIYFTWGWDTHLVLKEEQIWLPVLVDRSLFWCAQLRQGPSRGWCRGTWLHRKERAACHASFKDSDSPSLWPPVFFQPLGQGASSSLEQNSPLTAAVSASKLANHTSDLMPLHGLWQHSANFYLWLLILTNVVQTGNAGCIFFPFIDTYRLLLCSVLKASCGSLNTPSFFILPW